MKTASSTARLERATAPFAALFPGQLSETAGMGEALARRYSYAASFLEEASRRSGVDLFATFFGAGSPKLHDDLPAQVGVFAVSVAALDVLGREHGLVPAAAAGYSLGTYAAFVAAGALERREALDVLLEAYHRMEKAGRDGPPGAMGFVIGLPAPSVEESLAGVRADLRLKEGMLGIATVNAAQQFVLTGRRDAVEAAIDRLKPKALKAGMLPIGTPMHSPMLKAACDRLQSCFEGKIRVRQPRTALFSPMLGRQAVSASEAAETLFQQICRPSLWSTALSLMGASGLSVFAEVGPGEALTKMLRWTLRDAKGYVCESPEAIEAFAHSLKAHPGAPARSPVFPVEKSPMLFPGDRR